MTSSVRPRSNGPSDAPSAPRCTLDLLLSTGTLRLFLGEILRGRLLDQRVVFTVVQVVETLPKQCQEKLQPHKEPTGS